MCRFWENNKKVSFIDNTFNKEKTRFLTTYYNLFKKRYMRFFSKDKKYITQYLYNFFAKKKNGPRMCRFWENNKKVSFIIKITRK